MAFDFAAPWVDLGGDQPPVAGHRRDAGLSDGIRNLFKAVVRGEEYCFFGFSIDPLAGRFQRVNSVLIATLKVMSVDNR